MNRVVERRAGKIEGKRHFAVFPAGIDGRGEAAEETGIISLAEEDAVARLEPLRRPGQSLPAIGAKLLDQRDRDPRGSSIAPADSVKLGGDHLGIVEDERVARPKQLRQIADHAVGDRRFARGIDDKQPRGVARGHRAQRDQRLRQMKVEQIGTQRCVGG